jgi:hypothetical protein
MRRSLSHQRLLGMKYEEQLNFGIQVMGTILVALFERMGFLGPAPRQQ